MIPVTNDLIIKWISANGNLDKLKADFPPIYCRVAAIITKYLADDAEAVAARQAAAQKIITDSQQAIDNAQAELDSLNT